MKLISKKIKIGNFNIQLSIWEKDSNKKQVFCIHGISSNSKVWNTISAQLADNIDFIAMDIRGRGHSDAPGGYSLENHANDIKKIFDKLGIKKISVMGHSLGAYIAIVFSVKFPEYIDKLILFDGGGKLSQEQSNKVFDGIKPSLDRLNKIFDSFDEYLEYMKKAPFLYPWYEPMADYYKYELIEYPDGKVKSRVLPETIIEEIENLKKIDISEFYHKIPCPVYILRATKGMLSDDDLLLPENVLKEMLAKIPNAKVINFENTNHYTIVFYPNSKRDKILKEILCS